MHDLTDTSDVDSNLYPALLQVFTIILLGYLAGTLKIVNKEQSLGLNIFVGTFILPALLLKNIATLDFSKVEWLFLGSIAASKSLVFFVAMILTVITVRPLNLGLAAVFAIFVSQSNDFALGVPIIDAVYSKSHPSYIKYIYLIAPISLCFLNPIAFFFMELHEHWENNKMLEKKQRDETEVESESLNKKESKKTPPASVMAITSSGSSSSLQELQGFSEYFFEDDVLISRKKVEEPRKLSKAKLIKQTLWTTVKNPIVFMTFIGFLVNIICNRKIPALIEPIITTLANSFSALALFYLGLTMVGKIRNLTLSCIIMIIILILSKGLIFPLVTREMVYLFQHFNATTSKGAAVQSNDDLSTFGFLYGTFPSAPSLLIFIGKYKSIQQDLISSAIVFGTLASAPLMMVSGKMISIEYYNHSSKNFDEVQCKTAYGFSFATWFCGIWVLYVFLASGRILQKPHRYTFFLICAQMLNSLIHIVWTTTTNEAAESDIRSSYTYVFFSLFAAFLTRCIPLTIILNLISISKIERYNRIAFNRIIFKLADNNFFLALVGLILPLFAALLCLFVGGIPVEQGMMVAVGKRQVIISICLLVFVILSMAYCLILFARTKFDEQSVLSIVASKKTKYFSTASPTPSQFSGISSDAEGSSENLLNRVEEDRDDIYENRNTLAYINRLNAQYQIMQHISLVLILLFVTLMCLFFQIWVLKMEFMSGIFYELQLLDTTLLYGQGFFVFMVFGFDNEIIFEPVLFKLKSVFRLIKPFKLVPEAELPEETVHICEKFEKQYKHRCAKSLEKNTRFHYSFYQRVFSGSSMVDWFISHNLVKTRAQGKRLGRKLVEGRVLHHVTFKRDFYDGYHLYKFY